MDVFSEDSRSDYETKINEIADDNSKIQKRSLGNCYWYLKIYNSNIKSEYFDVFLFEILHITSIPIGYMLIEMINNLKNV